MLISLKSFNERSDLTHLVFRFQGIARDITEQRSFGKEKERLEEELRQFQKLEAIGLLAGGVAHDLDTVSFLHPQQ